MISVAGGAGGRGGVGRDCEGYFIDWEDRDKPSKLPQGPPGNSTKV